MTTLIDSIEINSSAETVFSRLLWLFASAENYNTWHKDHVTCQWQRGKPFEAGSVLYIEEYLHGKLHKFTLSGINIVTNSQIEFRLLFPASMICSGGAFFVEPKGDGCVLTASLSFRMSGLFKLLFQDRVDAIQQHMKEEGENLKQMLSDDDR